MDAAAPLYPRSLTPAVQEALADTPVVCVIGPRQSGKTTLAERLAPERAFVSLDEHNYRRAAEDDPDGFVAGLPPAVTLDEIQRVPALLVAVKRTVDRDRRPGRFLLTGSANPLLAPTVADSLTLAGLTADDWQSDRGRMGHLLESFVVQQVVAQTTWTDPDLRFWHYRDKEQVEVDVVVTRGRKTWGIEVKASGAITRGDGRGLARLADRCGDDFVSGIVLYAGRDILPLGDRRMLAVPLRELWDR